MSIIFYKPNAPFGCFSNFSKYGFEIDGKFWSSSEHYFQAQKFYGTKFEEEIRLASSAMEASILGRDTTKPLRSDWEEIKDFVMLDAILTKFRTHNDIKEHLLSTGNEEIIEYSTNDYYWGCGEKGTGKNQLGKILMQVRDILRREEA